MHFCCKFRNQLKRTLQYCENYEEHVNKNTIWVSNPEL
jgi:hypothetical protein